MVTLNSVKDVLIISHAMSMNKIIACKEKHVDLSMISLIKKYCHHSMYC